MKVVNLVLDAFKLVELAVKVLRLLLATKEFVSSVLLDFFHLILVKKVVRLLRVPAWSREEQQMLGNARRRQRRDRLDIGEMAN